MRPTKESSVKKRKPRGQGLVEYVLILAVVLGAVLTLGRPFFNSLRQRVGDGFKGGIFGNERSNLYYYPVRRQQR